LSPKSNVNVGKKVMKCVFLPYKLVEDVAYSMRSWFYSPFKGAKNRLPRAKVY
jgi:hypothetical protein